MDSIDIPRYSLGGCGERKVQVKAVEHECFRHCDWPWEDWEILRLFRRSVMASEDCVLCIQIAVGSPGGAENRR